MTKGRHERIHIPIEKDKLHVSVPRAAALPKIPRGDSKLDMIEFHAIGLTFMVLNVYSDLSLESVI